MARTRMLSTAVLLALLVTVALSVPGDGGQAAAVEPRTVTAKIMIPAGAFMPQQLFPTLAGWNYQNTGDRLDPLGYGGVFVAPVEFPRPIVSVTGITLYAWDNDPTGAVSAALYRSIPTQGDNATVRQAQVETVNSAADPQVVSTQYRIYSATVNRAVHSSYLLVVLPSEGILYGVQITYSYQTGG